MVTYALGLIRLKALALLLGPTGVGLFGYFQAAAGMLGTVTNLGVAQSGVRDVAEAKGSGDEVRIGRTVTVLRRVCWITGGAGVVVAAALALPLSHWSFGDHTHAGSIALLGLSLLFTAISAGQTALLQGLRRIGDLARINIVSAALGTVASVACYWLLGTNGIAHGLVLGAALTLVCSWWFARRIALPPTSLPWSHTFANARPLIKLGAAFAWSALLTAGLILMTRTLIIRDLGIEANGIYQAAWAISGLFAGFILGAMGADFYPRLTAISNDHEAANRLVNEQTEIGLLLALPGLVGTLAFGPEILHLLYSAEFLTAAVLLPWFVLGVLGRIISWPLGYLILAKGAAGWFLVTETVGNSIGAIALIILLRWQGLAGVAVAFFILYLIYTVIVATVNWQLTGFKWSSGCVRLGLIATFILIFVWSLHKFPPVGRLALGGGILLVSSVYSLLELSRRLGPNHLIARFKSRIASSTCLSKFIT